MAKDAKTPLNVLDENTRRYYLEVMGVQCWQLLESDNQTALVHDVVPAVEPVSTNTTDNTEVITQPVADDANWPRLETAIQQCDKCPLHKTRKQALPGRGNQSAEIMFVVLSPGIADDASGSLLSGEANDLFSRMLAAINVSIDDVYITSLLKCAVPAQHTVSPAELLQCNEHLKQQIQLIHPKLLVVLGDTAVRCFLQKDAKLDDFRELINVEPSTDVQSVNFYESVPLFVSYSPQELLQQPENKRKAWLDLQQLQKIIEA